MEKYKVTAVGQIFNIKTNKTLSKHIDKYGYERVNVQINGKNTQKQVHRLVAIAFISNPENKPQVNHINGEKTDNTVENLEWCTNLENRRHAVLNGLHKHQRYEVFKNNVKIGDYNSSTEISIDLSLDQSAVVKCANGKYKHTKGFLIKKI